MYSPHRHPDVRLDSQNQYERLEMGYAQKRRALYRYEVPPQEIGERRPYNIWEDVADHLDLATASQLCDFGANDGYFHQILRNKGFNGRYIGIDIQSDGLGAVEYIARLKHPNSDFIQGDVEDLSDKVGTSSADRVAAVFVGYHVGKPGKMLSELHRIMTPNGIAAVASRGIHNQLDTWEAARVVAFQHGYVFPQEINPITNSFVGGRSIETLSVYSHFGIDQTRQALITSKKFKLLHEYSQDSKLWIPVNDMAALDDLEGAIESLLPYTVKLASDLPLSDRRRRPAPEDLEAMSETIQTEWRQIFILPSARDNQRKFNLAEPYYISRAQQGFFIVKAIKK